MLSSLQKPLPMDTSPPSHDDSVSLQVVLYAVVATVAVVSSVNAAKKVKISANRHIKCHQLVSGTQTFQINNAGKRTRGDGGGGGWVRRIDTVAAEPAAEARVQGHAVAAGHAVTEAQAAVVVVGVKGQAAREGLWARTAHRMPRCT